jgi:hypothetical protein
MKNTLTELTDTFAEKLLKDLPKTQGQKPYFLPNQREQLIRYINACVELAQTPPLDRSRQQKQQSRNAIRAELNLESTDVLLDADGTPEIFNRIASASQNKANEFKMDFITKTFNGSDPELFSAYLMSFSEQQLNRKFTEATTIKSDFDSVAANLAYFTKTKAKLTNTPGIVLSVAPTESLELDLLKFRITVPNQALGYSIHNMLMVNNAYANKSELSTPMPYNGQLYFELSRAELLSLKHYLSQLAIWYRDFDMIFACILGENAEKYTRTGQKPLSEIIKTEESRSKANLPLFINPKVTQQMKTLPTNTDVLLIGQVALDLAQHPDRNSLRAFFESIYRKNNLRDNKNEPKTFVRDGSGYLSLLSILNIETIFNDLMAHATLASIAREMGFSSAASADFLDCLGSNTPELAYYQYLLQKLCELPITSVSGRTIREMAQRRFVEPVSDVQITEVQNSFNTHAKAMLDNLCGIKINPSLTQSAAAPLSQVQLKALLPQNRQQSTDLVYPTTTQDMDYLFNQLKSCQAYGIAREAFELMRQEKASEELVIDSLDIYLDKLNMLFKQRIQNTSGSGMYYGQEALVLAEKELMTFVSKIYYQAETGISQSSINLAFTKLYEIMYATSDNSHVDAEGCNRGLGGRIVALNTELTKEANNPILAADLNLRKEIADNIFMRLFGTGTETAMAYIHKPALYQKIGLATAAPIESTVDHRDQAFFNAFVTQYTPSAIYERCFTTLVDNFKTYAREEEDDKIYDLLHMLGFTGNPTGQMTESDKRKLDKQFRLNATEDNLGSKWNLSQFTLALPETLIKALLQAKIINVDSPKKLIIQGDSLQATSSWDREQAPTREVARNIGPNTFFSPNRVQPTLPQANYTANIPSSADNRYSVFGTRPQRTANNNAEQVRSVADSELATKPSYTSMG